MLSIMSREDFKISRRQFIIGALATGASGLAARRLWEQRVEAIETTIPPVTIDGVETYGHTIPLTTEQVGTVVTELNAKFDAGQTERRPDVYYLTQVIRASTYKNFPAAAIGVSSIQKFFLNHAVTMNDKLQTATPSVGRAMALRRVFVIEETAEFPASWHSGWFDWGGGRGIADTDGTSLLSGNYDPRGTASWDGGTDWALIHEDGHGIHFPDQYAVDFPPPAMTVSDLINFYGINHSMLSPQKMQVLESIVNGSSVIPPPLVGFPAEFQKYFSSLRNGILPNSLMNQQASPNGRTYNRHEASQALRRIKEGWAHDIRRKWVDLLAWPRAESSINTTFNVGTAYAGGTLDVYRTTKSTTGPGKTLDSAPVFSGTLDGSGKVVVGNPFSSAPESIIPEAKGGIDNAYATLFVLVQKDGQKYGAWLDIRFFQLAYWTGLVTAEMQFNLFSTTSDFNTFDWDVKFAPGVPYYKQYLPTGEEEPKNPSQGGV